MILHIWNDDSKIHLVVRVYEALNFAAKGIIMDNNSLLKLRKRDSSSPNGYWTLNDTCLGKM